MNQLIMNVLRALIDEFAESRDGPDDCEENTETLKHLEEALHWQRQLQHRVVNLNLGTATELPDEPTQEEIDAATAAANHPALILQDTGVRRMDDGMRLQYNDTATALREAGATQMAELTDQSSISTGGTTLNDGLLTGELTHDEITKKLNEL